MASQSVSSNLSISPESLHRHLSECAQSYQTYTRSIPNFATFNSSDLQSIETFVQARQKCHQLYLALRNQLKLVEPENPEILKRVTQLKLVHNAVLTEFKKILPQADHSRTIAAEREACKQLRIAYGQTLPKFDQFNLTELSGLENALNQFNQFRQLHVQLNTRLFALYHLSPTPDVSSQIMEIDQIHEYVVGQFRETVGFRIHYYTIQHGRSEVGAITEAWIAGTESLKTQGSSDLLSQNYINCCRFTEHLISRLHHLKSKIQQLHTLNALIYKLKPSYIPTHPHAESSLSIACQLAALEEKIHECSTIFEQYASTLYPEKLLSTYPLLEIPIAPRTISENKQWPADSTLNASIRTYYPFFRETSANGDSFFTAFIFAYLSNETCRAQFSEKLGLESMQGPVLVKIVGIVTEIDEHPDQIESILNDNNNLIPLIHYFREKTSHCVSASDRSIVSQLGEEITPNTMRAAATAFKFSFDFHDLESHKHASFARASQKPSIPSQFLLAQRGNQFLLLTPSFASASNN